MFAGMRGFESALRPSRRAERAAVRRRRSTARTLERLLDGPRLAFWRIEPRHRMHPEVLAAATSDLRAVHAAISDQTRPLPGRFLDDVEALLHDRTSALYGADPEAAEAAARRLRQRVAPEADAKLVTQPVPAHSPA
jgi:hypothetical protein